MFLKDILPRNGKKTHLNYWNNSPVCMNVLMTKRSFYLPIGIQSSVVPHCAAGGASCALPHAAEFPALSWGLPFGMGSPAALLTQPMSLSYGHFIGFLIFFSSGLNNFKAA